MSEQMTFVPSRVSAFFPNSVFNKSETEIMAAHIVAFLAANGDGWETVIEWPKFAEFTQTAKLPHPVYLRPFSNPFLVKGCQNSLWWFAENGYTVWVEEAKSFRVTDKMRQFYSTYVR